jgi:hypothetical protein
MNNEDALRAIVRDAVARHLASGDTRPAGVHPLILTPHVSHYRYSLPPSDGPCLIEPGVQCNHCGYCESHGH